MLPLRTYIQMFRQLRDDERGASAVEYGLLVAGIATGLLVAIQGFGGSLATFFTGLAARISLPT